jgi:HSP20 family protein
MRQLEEDLRVLVNQSFQKRFSFISPEEMWHPLTDVYETNKEIIVRMEVPGVAVKDLRIVLEDQKLVVQGNRKDPCQDEKISYHRMEINYGPFRRTILLPVTVQARGVKAKYANGFLEIKLPFSNELSKEFMAIDIE